MKNGISAQQVQTPGLFLLRGKDRGVCFLEKSPPKIYLVKCIKKDEKLASWGSIFHFLQLINPPPGSLIRKMIYSLKDLFSIGSKIELIKEGEEGPQHFFRINIHKNRERTWTGKTNHIKMSSIYAIFLPYF